MENKKLAIDSYELRQLRITQKATRIVYWFISLAVLLAVPTLFEPGNFAVGIITLVLSFIASLFIFLGLKCSIYIWVSLALIQVIYYFINLGKYFSPDYSMPWFLLICLRSAFSIYSSLTLIMNYDVKDIIFCRKQKIFKK